MTYKLAPIMLQQPQKHRSSPALNILTTFFLLPSTFAAGVIICPSPHLFSTSVGRDVRNGSREKEELVDMTGLKTGTAGRLGGSIKERVDDLREDAWVETELFDLVDVYDALPGYKQSNKSSGS